MASSQAAGRPQSGHSPEKGRSSARDRSHTSESAEPSGHLAGGSLPNGVFEPVEHDNSAASPVTKENEKSGAGERRSWFARTFGKSPAASSHSKSPEKSTEKSTDNHSTRSGYHNNSINNNRLSRQSASSSEANATATRHSTDLGDTRPYGCAAVSKKDPRGTVSSLKNESLETLVRICGKSLLYLPGDYATSSLILPTCLRAAAQYLVQKGPETSGIFRISGSTKVVNELYDYYCVHVDDDGDIAATVRSPNLPFHIKVGPHDVATMFKRILAGLPGGILGDLPLFEEFVSIHKKFQEIDACRLIGMTIGSIPSQFQRELICAVFGLLSLIGQAAEVETHSRSEKMGYSALGVIFGPLLVGELLELHAGGKSAKRSVAAAMSLDKVLLANRVAEMLITYWRDIILQMKNMGIMRKQSTVSRQQSLRRPPPRVLRTSRSEIFTEAKQPAVYQEETNLSRPEPVEYATLHKTPNKTPNKTPKRSRGDRADVNASSQATPTSRITRTPQSKTAALIARIINPKQPTAHADIHTPPMRQGHSGSEGLGRFTDDRNKKLKKSATKASNVEDENDVFATTAPSSTPRHRWRTSSPSRGKFSADAMTHSDSPFLSRATGSPTKYPPSSRANRVGGRLGTRLEPEGPSVGRIGQSPLSEIKNESRALRSTPSKVMGKLWEEQSVPNSPGGAKSLDGNGAVKAMAAMFDNAARDTPSETPQSPQSTANPSTPSRRQSDLGVGNAVSRPASPFKTPRTSAGPSSVTGDASPSRLVDTKRPVLPHAMDKSNTAVSDPRSLQLSTGDRQDDLTDSVGRTGSVVESRRREFETAQGSHKSHTQPPQQQQQQRRGPKSELGSPTRVSDISSIFSGSESRNNPNDLVQLQGQVQNLKQQLEAKSAECRTWKERAEAAEARAIDLTNILAANGHNKSWSSINNNSWRTNAAHGGVQPRATLGTPRSKTAAAVLSATSMNIRRGRADMDNTENRPPGMPTDKTDKDIKSMAGLVASYLRTESLTSSSSGSALGDTRNMSANGSSSTVVVHGRISPERLGPFSM